MTQFPDTQIYSIEEILEKLRSQAESMPPSPTSSRYLRAVTSLKSSVLSLQSSDYGQAARNAAQSTDIAPSAQILRTHVTNWLVSLWLSDTPFTTASLYLDIISSLYGSAVKAGQLPATKIFSQLKADLKVLGPRGWKSGIDDEIFERALRLTRNSACLVSDDSIAADLILLSLTHSLRPLTELALLKREDLDPNANSQRGENHIAPFREINEACEAIIARHCSNARRKYIFALRQAERTPKQLSRYIAKIVNALFRRARLPQSTDPLQTVEALWAYAALRAGIPASRIVSYLGHAPLGLPVLKLCKSLVFSLQSSDCVQTANTSYRGTAADTARSADTFKEYFSAVGKIFLDNPPRWYALSLRPGVRFTQLCRRLELLGDRVPQPQLFYPCEEITRAIGKKIVIRQRPFIHSVVFFRAKLTDIGRLLSKIGDLAWCYRRSASPGAPYADISERQFHLFQQTIAHFTPDYEVASTGEIELRKNDRVQIVGGLFAGHEANFVKSEESREKSEESHTIYRLNIVGDNGIEWRINVDSRLACQKDSSRQ